MEQKLDLKFWENLGTQFDPEHVAVVKRHLESGTSPEFDPYAKTTHPDQGLLNLLNKLSELKVIKKLVLPTCPNCDYPLGADSLTNRNCENCGINFDDEGLEPVEKVKYFSHDSLNRSVPWLVAIHGFNTRGDWQEEFSWRVANLFRYHAPVFVHKFGLLRYGVLFRYRHEQLARQLGEKIRNSITHAQENGIPEPPDIIAHSFGSLLFSLLLELEEFSDLRFGRLILAGSIVRPDYNWSDHIESGRIDAVMNHCGMRDNIVQISPFFIPNSGPSGQIGFQDPKVHNIFSPDYSHGTHFETVSMSQNLSKDGYWITLLKAPLPHFLSKLETKSAIQKWEPPWEWLLNLPRIATILLPWVALAMLFAWFWFNWIN